MSNMIYSEPCDCPPGQCAEGLPQDQCINVHAAAVTEFCTKCKASTWHEFGKCFRCGKQEDVRGWIGVDLDGTLAYYDTWKRWDDIGEPIPLMLGRVKGWLAEGKVVKIFTARVGFESDVCKISREVFTRSSMTVVIQRWTLKHIGVRLPVTATKDFAMVELWDDRAIQVVANTGLTIADEYESEMEALKGKAAGS